MVICPSTEKIILLEEAQVSNLETRGNETFSTLIDGLLHLQDPVYQKNIYQIKVKNVYIFDSRQQAANVALELGALSNVDEARRLLFLMHEQSWFKLLMNHISL